MAGVVLIIGILCTSTGRQLAQKWLLSLRVQKVQTVNVDLSPSSALSRIDPPVLD